jgi:hypothetical protein
MLKIVVSNADLKKARDLFSIVKPSKINISGSGAGVVFLAPESGTLNIVNSNNEAVGRYKCPMTILENSGGAGARWISMSMFQKLLGILRDGEVEITLDEDKVILRTLDGKFTLLSGVQTSPEEFYRMPKHPEISEEFSAEDWARIGRKTVFATISGKEGENRPVFAGITVKQENGVIRFYGTNSHMLARYEVESKTAKAEFGATVQSEAFSVKPDGDTVSLGVVENCTVVETGRFRYMFRNIAGTTPDFDRVIPADYEVELSANTADFKSALDKVFLIAGFEQGGEGRGKSLVPVQIFLDKDSIELYTNAQGVGEINAKLAAVIPDAAIGTKIAMSARYLKSIVDSMEGETTSAMVRVESEDGLGLRPWLFKEGAAIAVVTPMRFEKFYR